MNKIRRKILASPFFYDKAMRRKIKASPCFYDHIVSEKVVQHIGEIPNIPVGTVFKDRKSCCKAGVHTSVYAGISGAKDKGAFSVCLSGVYEDDVDKGTTVVYTGTGGQEDSYSDPGPQVVDQSFSHRSNAALKKSSETKRPVRVIRGSKLKYGPADGYRYDGLYVVEEAYLEKGSSGFSVCRFRLVRLPDQPPLDFKDGTRTWG